MNAHKTRVLLVDDEPTVLTSLGRWLNHGGYGVLTASDTSGAISVLEQHRVDVVLSDIVMPGAGGMALLDEVCARWPGLKVILMTGVPSVETASEAVRRGAYDYLVKPIDPHHISQVISRAAELKALEDDHRRLAGENARQRAQLAYLLAERTAEVAGAREELAVEKERLELALAGTRAGLWDWGVGEGSLIVSPRVPEILSVDPTSLSIATLLRNSVVHPDDREGVINAYREHASGFADVIDTELRIRVPSGWRWIRLRGHVVQRDEDEQPLRLVGTIVDVNARHAAQDALRAHMERALVTLHSIADAVLTTNAIGVVEQLNPVAESLTGWASEDARGRPLEQILDIELSDFDTVDTGLSELLEACLQRGERFTTSDGTRLTARNGQRFSVRCSLAPIRGSSGTPEGAVLVVTDVTERHVLSRRLRWEATHDRVTGLTNRYAFEHRLAAALERLESEPQDHELVVLHLDLDQFKVVNDSVGHAAGDELLRQVGRLLGEHVRTIDTVARFGGDEFSLLLEHCDIARSTEIAARINEAIRSHTFDWQGKTFEVTASIGIVPLESGIGDVNEVMSRADVACHMAKDLGRHRYHVYRLEDQAVMQRHGEIRVASEITAALQENRFCLHAQPIVALCSADRSPHYELLVRMLDRDGGVVPPINFIPAAERFNLMAALDRWVIREAFKAAATPGSPLQGETKIAINLSGDSLSDPGLLDYVCGELASSGVPYDRICFEITETAVVSRMHHAKRFMRTLRAEGCEFALDDFGTGLSSLTYLKELPVDYLKIDGAFVKNVTHDPIDHAMIAALNQLAEQMGILTIAEYVESQEIADRLQTLGVNYVQGYHFGRPTPIDQIVAKRP
ncbi:MAG: hypothetical protein CSA66_02630 [Proteobacteria bacterium]|nr:MAG: hypothetical protein CSA66_02630 [Pseudomonadota bacterium]